MERRPVSQIYRSPRIAIPSWGETSHGGERERSCSDAAIMGSAMAWAQAWAQAWAKACAEACAWLGPNPPSFC